jgi:hypothetical protein
MVLKKKNNLEINEFYDINKFPSEFGMTVIGISMPLIDNKQSASKCFESEMFLMDKIKKSGVGGIFSYSDGLYMNSDEPAYELKTKYQNLMEKHKHAFMKLVHKNIYIIPSAYTFTTWSQMILNCQSFTDYFKKIKEIYKKDKTLQHYVKLDIEKVGREVSEHTINYILEECLLDFLVAKMKIRLQNDYIQDKEKWILNSYHGKPHRTHAYIHQKNPLKIKSENCYENSWYDLLNKKLYEFDRLDIETFDFN